MPESMLFAIGCGVTFLFLGGVYIVLRTQLSEAYGVTSEAEERQGEDLARDLRLRAPSAPRVAAPRSTRAKRVALP